MADLIPPTPLGAIVKADGNMLQRFWTWCQSITRVANFSTMAEGTGTPEGSLSSVRNKFYNDTTGNNLYWKSVDDVAGDTSLGWLLVV